MLEVRNVKFEVGRGTPLHRNILNGIHFDVKKGEFVTVIGTNGAGKSTLLNIVSGELQPTSGKVFLGGQDVTDFPSYQRSYGIGRVFQDPMIGSCGDLTILENLCLAQKRGRKRKFREASPGRTREGFKKLLARLNLGLENQMDIPMGVLSGGQRQAVSLLMASSSPLDVLLLDEHTSALDPVTAKQVMEVTRSVVAEFGLTVFMVTHSLADALEFGDRTILLNRGRIVLDVSGEKRKALRPEDLIRWY